MIDAETQTDGCGGEFQEPSSPMAMAGFKAFLDADVQTLLAGDVPAGVQTELEMIDAETITEGCGGEFQQLATTAFGHKLPKAPRAKGAQDGFGVACWGPSSEHLARSFALWLKVKALHPFVALVVLSSAGRLLEIVKPLWSLYPPPVLHAVVIILATMGENEVVSLTERSKFFDLLEIGTCSKELALASAQCIEELGRCNYEPVEFPDRETRP